MSPSAATCKGAHWVRGSSKNLPPAPAPPPHEPVHQGALVQHGGLPAVDLSGVRGRGHGRGRPQPSRLALHSRRRHCSLERRRGLVQPDERAVPRARPADSLRRPRRPRAPGLQPPRAHRAPPQLPGSGRCRKRSPRSHEPLVPRNAEGQYPCQPQVRKPVRRVSRPPSTAIT